MGSITPANEYENVTKTFINSLEDTEVHRSVSQTEGDQSVYTYEWVSKAVSSLNEIAQNMFTLSRAVITGMNFVMIRFVNFISLNCDPGHIRRTVMYYRRYARHGGKK